MSPDRRVWYEDLIVTWQNGVDEFDLHRARGKERHVRAIVAGGGKSDSLNPVDARDSLLTCTIGRTGAERLQFGRPN